MMQILLVGTGAGAASALLFASIASGSPLSFVLANFAQLPIMLAAIGWTHLAGLTGALVASAGLAIAQKHLQFWKANGIYPVYFAWETGFLQTVGQLLRGIVPLARDARDLADLLSDPIIERAVDFVLADEITHVRMGSTWMRKLTEDDPARRQMALDFQHHIDELFNFGGARQDGPADQVSISISREARKMAGFTDEEIDRLVKAASASVVY